MGKRSILGRKRKIEGFMEYLSLGSFYQEWGLRQISPRVENSSFPILKDIQDIKVDPESKGEADRNSHYFRAIAGNHRRCNEFLTSEVKYICFKIERLILMWSNLGWTSSENSTGYDTPRLKNIDTSCMKQPSYNALQCKETWIMRVKDCSAVRIWSMLPLVLWSWGGTRLAPGPRE